MLCVLIIHNVNDFLVCYWGRSLKISSKDNCIYVLTQYKKWAMESFFNFIKSKTVGKQSCNKRNKL
jgi:hypothetical protein